MKHSKNILQTTLIFVGATVLGFILGKWLLPASEKYEETISDTISVDPTSLPEPIVPETETEEAIAPATPVKEIERKQEEPAKPVMTAAEFKQHFRANSFDYKRDFHGGITPTFKVYGQRPNENDVTDFTQLRLKLNPNMDPHWDDFDVGLDYDTKGKISVVVITPIYH